MCMTERTLKYCKKKKKKVRAHYPSQRLSKICKNQRQWASFSSSLAVLLPSGGRCEAKKFKSCPPYPFPRTQLELAAPSHPQVIHQLKCLHVVCFASIPFHSPKYASHLMSVTCSFHGIVPQKITPCDRKLTRRLGGGSS